MEELEYLKLEINVLMDMSFGSPEVVTWVKKLRTLKLLWSTTIDYVQSIDAFLCTLFDAVFGA
ncbi:hypothetical protein [uncultured Shewanella sp.]|uniref:hypothetical protein n=1 Tax=uncultured Shewanella sp. TaxID=173975 RepID=UPI00261D8664|nr:hypothetical protein [uncultured Shewanella sp.]